MSTSVQLSYDRQHEIMNVTMPKMQVRWQQQADEVFVSIDLFWKRTVAKKVYCLIDYTGFSIDKPVADYWGSRIRKAVLTYSITTVRYSDDPLTRATIRSAAMKVHTPGNMYGSRQEALGVVSGLKNNSIRLVG